MRKVFTLLNFSKANFSNKLILEEEFGEISYGYQFSKKSIQERETNYNLLEEDDKYELIEGVETNINKIEGEKEIFDIWL